MNEEIDYKQRNEELVKLLNESMNMVDRYEAIVAKQNEQLDTLTKMCQDCLEGWKKSIH